MTGLRAKGRHSVRLQDVVIISTESLTKLLQRFRQCISGWSKPYDRLTSNNGRREFDSVGAWTPEGVVESSSGMAYRCFAKSAKLRIDLGYRFRAFRELILESPQTHSEP